MRRCLTAVACGTALLTTALPAAAIAHSVRPKLRTAWVRSPRPVDLLEQARTDATKYWHGNPRCGPPRITRAELNDFGGWAIYGACTIEINSDPRWIWTARDLCLVMLHEWGHLVLGAEFFASSNPTDPAHAPPGSGSVMMSGPAIYALLIPECRS